MQKRCPSCGLEKLLTEFRKDRNRLDGRRTDCKVCSRNRQNTAYPQKYREKAQARGQTIRDENAKRITELKRSTGCRFCLENTPVCLDFHHLDPTAKEYGVGTMTGRFWHVIEKEIAKTIIVCANCHRKIHAGIITL